MRPAAWVNRRFFMRPISAALVSSLQAANSCPAKKRRTRGAGTPVTGSFTLARAQMCPFRTNLARDLRGMGYQPPPRRAPVAEQFQLSKREEL